MSKKENEDITESSIERDLIEVKSLVKENYNNIRSMKQALEKLGLGVVDTLGKFKTDFEDLRKYLTKLDSFEITLRGLRFTTKETLEKLINRILEVEKIIKDTPKVDAIVVQEVQEKEVPVKTKTSKIIPKISADDTATVNTLHNLRDFIKQQIPIAELVNRIEDTRDTLMSWTPHHPVFYEMREWISKIKRLPKNQPLPPNESNQLLKDIENWLERLVE
jgi:hypothetical protein